MSPSQKKAYLLALTAVLFWATVPTAFKLGLQEQSIYQLLSGSSLVSLLVLGIAVLFPQRRKLLLKITWKDLLFSAAMGLINPFVYYLVLFKAYSLLPAQVAQPLNMVWPLVLVLFSIPVLKQKIGIRSIAALLVSFGGVVLISLQGGNPAGNSGNLTGVLLALLTSVMWALYWVLNARDQQDKVLRLFLNFLFAALYLAAGSFFISPAFPVSLRGWETAGYVGVFEMGLSFIFWLLALKFSETTDKVSNLVYIAPFLNLLFVHLILGERIFLTTIGGIILIITGILLQNVKRNGEKRAV
ncbi:MAG: DMT family transporter [Bacteroidota bacterium]